jgi:hypothetical protein
MSRSRWESERSSYRGRELCGGESAIGGAIFYLIVAFTLGLMALRNRHGWMFSFGIFPALWIFGAFMRPSTARVA